MAALVNTDLASPNPLINNPVTIAAGTILPDGSTTGFRSEDSQVDADDQALTACEADRRCAFGNRQITVLCPASQEAGEAIVPNTLTLHADGTETFLINIPGGIDPAEVSESIGRPRIGTVIVDPNVFLSTESVADAEALATEAAQARLDCFYINKRIEVYCHQDSAEISIDLNGKKGGNCPPVQRRRINALRCECGIYKRRHIVGQNNLLEEASDN